jgi:hypothetical protein
MSAQTNRNRCELAEGSVKFENVVEEQENRRTRKEIGWTKRTIRSAPSSVTSTGQAAYLKP